MRWAAVSIPYVTLKRGRHSKYLSFACTEQAVAIISGTLLNLFRLKKWQNDLKACWEKLEAGEYDWAHLAYSAWPDRVREKCKIDRSIAIVHDFEDICEVQPKNTAKRQK